MVSVPYRGIQISNPLSHTPPTKPSPNSFCVGNIFSFHFLLNPMQKTAQTPVFSRCVGKPPFFNVLTAPFSFHIHTMDYTIKSCFLPQKNQYALILSILHIPICSVFPLYLVHFMVCGDAPYSRSRSCLCILGTFVFSKIFCVSPIPSCLPYNG